MEIQRKSRDVNRDHLCHKMHSVFCSATWLRMGGSNVSKKAAFAMIDNYSPSSFGAAHR